MKKFTVTIASLFFALFLIVGCDNAPKAEAEAAEDVTVIEKVEVAVDTVAVEVDTTVVVEEVVEEIVD